MQIQEILEVIARDRPKLCVIKTTNRRRTGALIEQRHLAEALFHAEIGDALAIMDDLYTPTQDEIDVGAGLALFEYDVAALEGDALDDIGEGQQLLTREAGK